MYQEFKFAIISDVYIQTDDKNQPTGRVYCTLESAFEGGFGKFRAILENIDGQELLQLGKLPYNVQADERRAIFGSGKDATNMIYLENVHIEDVLGMRKVADGVMKAMRNGKSPEPAK